MLRTKRFTQFPIVATLVMLVMALVLPFSAAAAGPEAPVALTGAIDDSSLVRSPKGIFMSLHASGLTPGSAITEWLIVTGSNYAMFKGSGTVNGQGDYQFMVWGGDQEPDTLRIKIWEDAESGAQLVVYDNGFDQAVHGGSIVIHGE